MIMVNRLTQKQETFCLKYFELGNATQAALIAGYCPRTARQIASLNLTKIDIQNRLAELRQKVEDESVANVLERKQRLTEIVRANVGQYVDEVGNLDISDKGKLDNAAVQEIKTKRTRVGIKSTLKLRDPIAAITELNKMDGIYETGTNVNLNFTWASLHQLSRGKDAQG